MQVTYGIGNSMFGTMLLVLFNDKIAFLEFISNAIVTEQQLYDRIKRNNTVNTFERNDVLLYSYMQRIFSNKNPIHYDDLNISISVFTQKVLKAVMNIGVGKTRSYKQIAEIIGHPKAYQAVGRALGSNPCAYLIACHRVIAVNGALGGFKWGITLKQRLFDYEKASLA